MSALSVADVLDRAADLIEPEGTWTQRANARDAKGEPTHATSAKAVSFCMAGAVIRASGGAYPIAKVKQVLPEPVTHHADWLVAYNDDPERTQAEVVAKLREAAALARSTPNDADNQREEGE